MKLGKWAMRTPRSYAYKQWTSADSASRVINCVYTQTIPALPSIEMMHVQCREYAEESTADRTVDCTISFMGCCQSFPLNQVEHLEQCKKANVVDQFLHEAIIIHSLCTFSSILLTIPSGPSTECRERLELNS